MDAKAAGVLVADDNGNEIRLVPIDARVDINLVDAVARLHLAGRRLGLTILIRDPCAELRALLDLAGLTHLLADVPTALAAPDERPVEPDR